MPTPAAPPVHRCSAPTWDDGRATELGYQEESPPPQPCITHRGSFKAKLSEVAGLRAGLVRCFTSLEPKLRALHPVRGTTGSLSQSNSSSCSRGRARGSCSQEAVLVEEGMGSGAEGGSRLGRASRKSSQQTPVGKFHMVGGGMKENQREFLSLWMRSG